MLASEVKSMFLGIFYGIVTFFALIGLIALIYYTALRSMRLHADNAYIVVLPARVGMHDIAGQLYAEKLRMTFWGDGAAGKVVALDCGMEERCRTQCEALCRELDHTVLLCPEELVPYVAKHHCQ